MNIYTNNKGINIQGIERVAKISVPFAKQIAPIAARTVIGSTTGAVTIPKKEINTLLWEGEQEAEQLEAGFFSIFESEIEISNTKASQERALTEVLAAEASHSEMESEAAGFLGTTIPIAIKSVNRGRTLLPLMPYLVEATARLVRLLHRQGLPGRRLFRLFPTILHRTIASLLASKRISNRPITPALVKLVMAAQTARVLGSSSIVSQAMIRNGLIRSQTVSDSRKPNFTRRERITMQGQAMFEAPASHEAVNYSNPYSNPEYEDEWEIQEAVNYSNPYSNPEYEDEWEMQEANPYSHPYSNPEDEWEMQEATHYSNPYSNPEYEDEWEMQEANPYSHPYSNPENEWEMQETNPYSHPYSNPEYEDEGEYFFKNIGRGLKKLAKVAAPLAKRFAPIIAGKLATMIPGVGVVAGPLAAKLTSQLLREGEMEATQMEAEFFGTNEAVAEVANTEVAHEAALTEFLAAQAAEATNEAEAEAAIGASLPITITIMGGRRALRPVTPILSQANATLVRTLARQGKTGRQLLRTVPAINRRAIATLKAVARSGQPINGATAAKAMAAATKRVLSNPRLVEKSIVRNAVLRQRTAPPNPRRTAAGMASRCPTCATPVGMARR
jgi:hypothetical protein